jgi:hypothetical protein
LPLALSARNCGAPPTNSTSKHESRSKKSMPGDTETKRPRRAQPPATGPKDPPSEVPDAPPVEPPRPPEEFPPDQTPPHSPPQEPPADPTNPPAVA